MRCLWQEAVKALEPEDRPGIELVAFHRSQRTPVAIGGAMFEALYGQGADVETKAGGVGGLLTAVNVRNYLVRLEPGYVSSLLGEGWETLDEAQLQKLARQVPVRVQDVGRHLLDRILRDGKYRDEGGIVMDGTGKPLSVPVFVRLNKALASTFGNFFLKFQNTHPQNAVILARVEDDDPHPTYRNAGKIAAVLTYLARAMGASSILKTGPIDLARDAIASILVENPDADPSCARWVPELRSGRLKPAMTFQVGYPLAGSEVIDEGTPHAHTGLEERKKDKRPPRERFVTAYFPNV